MYIVLGDGVGFMGVDDLDSVVGDWSLGLGKEENCI
jgi:hypothetical protein